MYILLAFIMTLVIGLPAKAESVVTQGSILKSINLIQQDDEFQLQIRGVLNPSQLSKIRIRQKAQSKSFTISIPSTLVDPDGLPNSLLTFKDSDPIENITINEAFQVQGNGTVTFTVDLVVEAKNLFRPSVMKPITRGMLLVRLEDYNKVTEPKETEDKASRKQSRRTRAERMTETRRRELEEQKQRAAVEAKKSLNEIIKQFHKPTVMQVSILNGSGAAKKAYQLSVFLGSLQKRNIEERLGVKMDIVNISNTVQSSKKPTTIFYRENFLKSALYISNLIDGEQHLIPMVNQAGKMGVDIEIYLGKDYK